MWQRLYKQGSSREGGTLNQLRNLINRKNVSEAKGKDVRNNVNEIEDFLVIVIECYVITAALNHFGMSDMSDMQWIPKEYRQVSIATKKRII